MVQDAVRGLRPARTAIGLAALGLLAFASTPARASMIDPFSSAKSGVWPMTTPGNTSGSSLETTISGVLGATRATRTKNSSPAIPANNLQTAVVTSPGYFDYSAPLDTDGKVTLIYNANHEIGEPGPGMQANLSSDPAIQVDLLDFDLAGGLTMPVKVTLTDGAGNVAFYTQVVTVGGLQSVNFPYVLFSGFGSLDLTHIDEIDVELDPGIGAHFRIDAIYTTVPEPGMLAAWAVACAAIGRRRRN